MQCSSTLRYSGRSSMQIFRDLVYFSTGYRLPEEAIVVTVEPNPYQSSDVLGRNTVATTMMPTKQSAYRTGNTTGNKTVTYSRYDLSVIKPRWDRYFDAPQQDTSTHAILDQINQFFDTCFTDQDLEDLPIEAARFNLILKASEHSVAWVGQYGSVPQLSTYLPVKKLSGFTVYQNPTP